MKHSTGRGLAPGWIATIAALVSLAAACAPAAQTGPAPAASSGQPKQGGTLRIESNQMVRSYDIHQWNQNFQTTFLGKFYNTLLYTQEAGNIVCDVCADWKIENGGLTFDFPLRQDVKFFDGRTMTSADVKYSLERVLGQHDFKAARLGFMMQFIQAIDTPGPYELKLSLSIPQAKDGIVAAFLSLAEAGIMPAGTTSADLQDKPLGTGPFLLDSNDGSVMKMKRNPNYFKKGLPYVDAIEVYVFPDDAVAISALLTKKIDQVRRNINPYQDPQLNQLIQQGQVQVVDAPSTSYPNGVIFNLSRSPFDNLTLRQAVNLALDRKAYIDVVWDGRATPMLAFPTGSVTQRTDADFWDKIPGWGTGANKAQEVQQAKQLVAQAGYPNGLDVTMPVGDQTSYKRNAEFVRQQLQAIGIRVNTQIIDYAVWVDQLNKRDYVAHTNFSQQLTAAPDELWYRFLSSKGSSNLFLYSNPDMDAAIAKQATIADPNQRAQFMRSMEENILLRDLPYAPLPLANTFNMTWSYVKGYRFGGNNNTGAGSRLEDVWLER